MNKTTEKPQRGDTDEQIKALLKRQGKSDDYIRSYLRGWRQIK